MSGGEGKVESGEEQMPGGGIKGEAEKEVMPGEGAKVKSEEETMPRKGSKLESEEVQMQGRGGAKFEYGVEPMPKGVADMEDKTKQADSDTLEKEEVGSFVGSNANMPHETEMQLKCKLHQYVEKIALPREVDPYAVRAFVYKNGNLIIEAPLVG